MNTNTLIPAATLLAVLVVPTSVGPVPDTPIGDTPERRSPTQTLKRLVSSHTVYATAGGKGSRPITPAVANHLEGIEQVAEAVGFCESGNNYGAQNPASTASGRFQFIDGTWLWVWEAFIGEPAPTLRAKHADPSDQDRAFAALWDDGRGKSHWAETLPCIREQLGGSL